MINKSLNCELNPFNLKLPQLLAHFLYLNKTLSLQGLGVFSMDPKSVIPEWSEKEVPMTVQGINFENKPVSKPDDKLIDFIHQYTGKMKPLAMADLDSYLNLGIQLINIGKPFYIEGIGSIHKNNLNKYEFEPGDFSQVKLTLPHEEQADISDKREKHFDTDSSESSSQPVSGSKAFIFLGIVAGLALVTWGGYHLYKKTSSEKQQEAIIIPVDTTSKTKDSLALVAHQTDSLNKRRELQKMGLDTNSYRFVILATPNRKRAEKRYQQLALSSSKVKMETKDSTLFKVYFPIATTPKDTLKIKDSLNAFFATKTIIEK
jgi:hypothetical protein